MNLLIAAPDDIDVEPLVNSLRPYEVSTRTLTLGPNPRGSPDGSSDLCVLIWPRPGVVAVGERVAQLRRQLGPTLPLMACMQKPTIQERQLIAECGASEVITPRHWALAAIAERILAQLILTTRVHPTSFGKFRGGTQPMRQVYQDIETFASLPDPVLIVGETGTGKELVAHELHRLSGHPGAVTAIDCGTLSPDLLGSELFGHVRGAFTGANSARTGLLVAAGSGTVFLDELPSLSLAAQAQLLRVIEERQVRPVGGNQWQPIRARLVLATNRDLEEAVEVGAFRRDLHERIQAFRVVLPPLRDRRADIPLLVEQFLEERNREDGLLRTIAAGAIDGLFRHDWPGNVRELRLTVRVAAAGASRQSSEIGSSDFDKVVQRRISAVPRNQVVFDPAVDTWPDVLGRARKAFFGALLAASMGNKEIAWKRTGLKRSQSYEIFKKLEEGDDSESPEDRSTDED